MNNILVVGPAWVGDMVMAQSLFKALKRAQADAQVDAQADAQADNEISVLAPPWSIPILARMPEVAHTIRMTVGHGALGLGARHKIGRQLRRSNFDHAIVVPNSFKSALVPWFAKIPRRTGYLGEQRWGLLNDIRILDRRVMPLNVQRFVALGLPKSSTANAVETLQSTDLPKPALAVNRELVGETAARFKLQTDAPVLALCPGAEYGPAKQWPAAHFAEVANAQLAQGWRVWLFGSDNDRQIAARINQLCQRRCADLAGRTSLGEAIDLMSLAKYAVTNDSGLMHIAAAVGCHVIAIYGSSSDAFTPPLTEHCDCLTLRLECSPCFQRECPLDHLNCLNQLMPKKVLDIIKKMGNKIGDGLG
ncbi:lipopolysaccharide heptosyltransferase II [Candidatus Spongiihabitans sp.]|uniref:lipopolysaccharide heptosyltransferase II n=1 Tax=Candidatus Spongiihabitans sp. TaxID=3101308 RepID=UPI003C6EBE8E